MSPSPEHHHRLAAWRPRTAQRYLACSGCIRLSNSTLSIFSRHFFPLASTSTRQVFCSTRYAYTTKQDVKCSRGLVCKEPCACRLTPLLPGHSCSELGREGVRVFLHAGWRDVPGTRKGRVVPSTDSGLILDKQPAGSALGPLTWPSVPRKAALHLWATLSTQ